MTPVRQKFKEQLVNEGVLSQEEADGIEASVFKTMESEYQASKSGIKHKPEEWSSSAWESISKTGKNESTAVPMRSLKEIGNKITKLPEDWAFHPGIKKIYKARFDSIDTGKGIDWGTAEALAFSTLIDDGFHVRLSGQDVQRGTFSHRHAQVRDQKQDRLYTPIDTVRPDSQMRHFIASNSHLSEYAVLGYELGYA
jgi:2-oxoglutarate dehydrogenase E1 component